MKNLIILYFLTIYCLFSCKKTVTINKDPGLMVDTIVTKSALYLLTPDDEEIKEIKKRQGEDSFYTIADDANYYMAEIENTSHDKIHRIHHRKINFTKEKYIFDKNSSQDKWLILDYTEGNKPKVYSLVDYYSHLNNKTTEKFDNKSFLFYENNEDYLIKGYC